MGVFSRLAYNAPKAGAALGKAASVWQTGFVRVVRIPVGESVYDVATNTMVSPEPELIWQGQARMAAVRSNLNFDQGFGYGKIMGVRFQVPLDISVGFFRTGFQVQVVDGGNDPSLEHLQYTISSAINSNLSFVRTIECEANLTYDRDPDNGEFDEFPQEGLFPAADEFPED